MQQVNFDDWKARCHYLGELTSKPRTKHPKDEHDELSVQNEQDMAKARETKNKETKTYAKLIDKIGRQNKRLTELESRFDEPYLSDTAKARLAQVYTEVTTGRTKKLKNKYVEKGLHCEEDAITLYSMATTEMFRKDTEELENDYITGHIDFRKGDWVFDTKSSWDVFTFDATVAKPMNPIYKWQGKGYMWLTGLPKFKLVYALLNTPPHMVDREKFYFSRDFIGTEDELKVALEEIDFHHNYDDLPIERKIRTYDLEHDPADDEAIKKCIIECRKYLNNFSTFKITEDEDEN